MKPGRSSAKENQHHIGQRTGSQATRNRQMEPPPDAAFFPLSLEVVERQCREALLGAPATTTVTYEQMAVMDPNLLGCSIGSRDLPERALGECFPVHAAASPVLRPTDRSNAHGREAD